MSYTSWSSTMGDTSIESAMLGLLIASLPISFLLSFAIGANDVANSFGTSYGSGVLTIRQCCILATIFESLGAVLLGYNVSETVRTGVFDVGLFNGNAPLLALGYFSALIGSALWNLLATMLKLPVSGTHSILGAVLGFAVIARGWAGVKALSLSSVVASWFISPALAGLVSMAALLLLRRLLERPALLQKSLAGFYSLVFFVNAFSILFLGPKFLEPSFGDVFEHSQFGQRSLGALFALGISLVIAATAYFVAALWWLPRSARLAEEDRRPGDRQSVAFENGADSHVISMEQNGNGKKFTNGVKVLPFIDDVTDEDRENRRLRKASEAEVLDIQENSRESLHGSQESIEEEGERVFRGLQVLTACFGAFAHGANDVSNAIGPLIALFLIHNNTGDVYQRGETPFYLFLFGGFGISCGVWALGRRVIETIGKDLSKEKLTPSVGFTVELSSSLTVLLASKLGFPISTTHCKVGSVVSLAWLSRRLKMASRNVAIEEESDHGDASVNANRVVEEDLDKQEKESMEKENSTVANVDVNGEVEGLEVLEGDDEGDGVNWKLFAQIGGAWLLTVPISALMSGGCFMLLRIAFPVFESDTRSDSDFVETPFFT